MECDICSRAPHESLDFFCAACARNFAYVLRLEHAQVLLEKAALGEKVEHAISPEHASPPSTKLEGTLFDRKVWQNELKHAQINEVKRELEQSNTKRCQTNEECQNLQTQIEELKGKIADKRKNLQVIQKNLATDRESHLSHLTSTSSTTSSSILRLQQKSMVNKAILCREAASLMRLRQRRRDKDASGKEQYSVAGLTLPDLRDISNVRCADLTAVLGSVVRLVLLVAFYLGIRLPAEINMPAPGRALSSICAPNASYTGKRAEILALGNPTSTSTSSSPSASKHEIGASLKPRPLSIGSDDRDERVFTFQKREPYYFNLFVEGITLLAWNTAWLCRTQGFTVGTNSWEEICNIGKNLHQLLIANRHTPSLTRIHSDRSLPKRPSPSRKPSSVLDEVRKDAVGRLAQHSGLSAASQGNRSFQVELMRAWEFSNWQAVALPLRKTLLTEIASADWELLKDQEWDDGGEQFDEAVFIKSRVLDSQQYDDARSIMTTRTRLEDDASALNRAPGTSGWTKLKNREK